MKLPKLLKPFQNKIIGHGLEKVDQLLANPFNYRIHSQYQQEALAGSMDDLGFIRSVTVNQRTGHMIDGHLRVVIAERSDVEEIMVEYVDLSEEEELEALTLLDPISALAGHDREKFRELTDLVKTEDERVKALLQNMRDKDFRDPSLKDGKPNRRHVPIDLIFTWGGGSGECCAAVSAGMKYGFQSSKSWQSDLCPRAMTSERHKVVFVDNDYFHYDQAIHLETVKGTRPKYATVRDIMSEAQCMGAGIEYYPLEQILDWAEELSAYAENVILIPKYDCFDDIPEKFMLGYSVPSSHGSTPLPGSMFAGRRVHLLGGSWKAQLAYLSTLGDAVVSLDTNYIAKIAMFGEFTDIEGKNYSLFEELGGLNFSNVFGVCITISAGMIVSSVKSFLSEELLEIEGGIQPGPAESGHGIGPHPGGTDGESVSRAGA